MFPENPKKAIENGFALAESTFLEKAQSTPLIERSGSCAIVILIIDNMCYCANLGDSRAILSLNGGANFISLTQDHKPQMKGEETRILNSGGKIY